MTVIVNDMIRKALAAENLPSEAIEATVRIASSSNQAAA
jgi:hypothetical protein